MTRLFSLLLLLCLLAASPSVAQNQPAAAPGAARTSLDESLKNAQAIMRSVAQGLAAQNVTDAKLQELRAKLEPAHAAALAAEQDLTPRLDAAKARLAQLGPEPKPGAPPEAPTLSADRAQQLKFQTALNAQLSQAKLLLVDTDQLSDRISAARRNLFVNSVFAQSYSVFSPGLWTQVVSEAPGDAASAFGLWSHFAASATARLDGWSWLVFIGALLVIGLLYGLCAGLVRRILLHESSKDPSKFAKALTALWVAFLTALAPGLCLAAIVVSLRAFGLIDSAGDPVQRALVGGVVRITLATALARGLLSPGKPRWRLLDLSTPVCERLFRLVVGLSIIVSLGKVVAAVADRISVSLAMSVAINAVAALVVALAMAVSLRGILPDESETEDCLGPRVRTATDWYAPLRVGAWAAIAGILLSVAIGYVAFASFLVNQLVWVSLVGTSLYIAVALAGEGLTAAFKPNAAIGRAFIKSLGVRRESLQQFAILASGAATLSLCVIAVFLLLAPWGIESTDMLGGLRAAFFGFHFGNLTISLSAIVVAAVLFAFGLLATRWIQRWFDTQFLPATQLDVGLRNSIRTSVGYVGVVAAAAVALAHLGLDFQKLAIVAGALSVGIGFGLQSIVNNFVSGLIILWERAIRVGDLVVVGDDQGHVKRINVRSTEIETSDRVTMIVPNSNLVSGVVKNWVRSDRIARIRIPLPLGLGADPEDVRDLLVGCARETQGVIKLPAPQALFTAIEGANLKFELICFVDDVETAARVKSDLHFELFRRLKAAGLEPTPGAPAPAAVTVKLEGVDRLIAESAKRGFEEATAGAPNRASKQDGE